MKFSAPYIANKRPADLEDAELLFNNERVYKRRRLRIAHQNSVDMTPQRCLDCDKLGFLTEQAARIVISRMLTNGTLQGPDSFSFRPYLCFHGWWHTGHDPNSRRVFRNLAAQHHSH